MKKIILSLLLIALSIGFINAQEDKAFHKGTITVDGSIGFVLYKTKSHTEQDEQYWTGTSIATRRVKKDTTDAAGASIYALNGEYGVTDWLGIGFRFGYSNYIEGTQDDSIYNASTLTYSKVSYKPKARSVDFGVNVNFHLVKGKRFDMPICLTMGYSNFKYSQNNPDTDSSPAYDNSGAVAKDNGLNYGILLMPKIYFGKEQHVGLAFHVGYLGSNYPSLQLSNKSDSNTNDNNNATFKLKGNGFNIGIGLSVKF